MLDTIFYVKIKFKQFIFYTPELNSCFYISGRLASSNMLIHKKLKWKISLYKNSDELRLLSFEKSQQKTVSLSLSPLFSQPHCLASSFHIFSLHAAPTLHLFSSHPFFILLIHNLSLPPCSLPSSISAYLYTLHSQYSTFFPFSQPLPSLFFVSLLSSNSAYPPSSQPSPYLSSHPSTLQTLLSSLFKPLPCLSSHPSALQTLISTLIPTSTLPLISSLIPPLSKL